MNAKRLLILGFVLIFGALGLHASTYLGDLPGGYYQSPNDDFEQVENMTYEEFKKLPQKEQEELWNKFKTFRAKKKCELRNVKATVNELKTDVANIFSDLTCESSATPSKPVENMSYEAFKQLPPEQ